MRPVTLQTRHIMASNKLSFILSTFILVVYQCVIPLGAQLQVGFYNGVCDFVEFIIKQEVRNAFIGDAGVAAGLVRMHFHDCFVRGCDGSVLIDSTPSNQAEKDAPANNPSLRGFEVIDNAKSRLEFLCPGIVSCADILAYAARDSVEITGGLGYDVPAGRRDGRISSSREASANLPSPASGVNQLIQAFANKGLRPDEMVTLSGAHTIGRSHCTSFSNRLFNFNTTTTQDPSMDPLYAAQLAQQCPQGSISNPNLVVPLDPSTPTITDTRYYDNILANRGLFTSDQSLLTNPSTANQVIQNAQNPFVWRSKFADAMVRMGQIGVLTGGAGEIRANCRVINS